MTVSATVGRSGVILHITTVPMSLVFLRGQAAYMRERGLSMHALSSPGPDLDAFAWTERVPVHRVRMIRRITPLRDLRAVAGIWRAIREVEPLLVHAHTPKGGLLGMIAATLGRVPVRVYQMRGLPFATASGLKRELLRWTEKLACTMADEVLCNSHSLRDMAIAERICGIDKIKVLVSGSGNGVDASERFHPGRLGKEARAKARGRWGIPPTATVVGFVGRVVRDKGVVELIGAWRLLRDRHPELHLVIVGPFEPEDPLPGDVLEILHRDPRVHLTGMDWDTPPLYAAMDLVVLPTYREGFPNVPLEAAAMGLPVVATRVPGCVDAVEDGKTGMLVPPRDVEALAEAIRRYVEDPTVRRRHGEAGRLRVLAEFSQERIWEALYSEYRDLLARRRRGGQPSSSGLSANKRAMDVMGAAAALVVLSPLIACVACAVRVFMGRPILFRQQRPGLGGREFTMYKFRTMREDVDAHGEPLDDAVRLTRLGRFLRRTSLDELPELWNVLMGDMSLVGPRPLLMEYLTLYTPRQARRHEVRPGITGWAQIHGRNATTWTNRLELDVWYVENRSFLLDLRILVSTLKKVLLGDGISAEGTATMTRFRGTAR